MRPVANLLALPVNDDGAERSSCIIADCSCSVGSEVRAAAAIGKDAASPAPNRRLVISAMLVAGLERDNNRLRRGRVADVGLALEVNQLVGFGEVGGDIGARNVV